MKGYRIKFHRLLQTQRKKLLFLALLLGAILLTILWFLPIVFLFINANKTSTEIAINPWSLSFHLRPDIILKAWKVGRFSRYYGNSIYVTSVSVLFTLFISSLAAFSFALLKFKGREFLLYFIIAGMMFNVYTIIVPLYILIRELKLLNSLEGIIIADTVVRIPFSVYFLTMFFRTIPQELVNAAQIDGCSWFRIYWKIVMPLSLPSLAAVGIFVSTSVWNEFFLVYTFIKSESLSTIPVGLLSFRDQYHMDVSGQISAVLIASIPLVLLYFVLQRQFIAGLTAGALKE